MASFGKKQLERIDRTRKPRKCPNCGFSPVATIFYGHPGGTFITEADKIKAGEIVFGGCTSGPNIDPSDPTWECSKCGQQICKRPRRKKRIEMSRRPKGCTTCGFSPVGEILWGMPDMDSKLQKSIEDGRIIIGGCCLSLDDPSWECSKCKQQIWKPIPEEEQMGGECSKCNQHLMKKN